MLYLFFSLSPSSLCVHSQVHVDAVHQIGHALHLRLLLWP